MMKFKSFLPPSITTLNGKRYVVPGFHPIDDNTTLEDVFNNWEQDKVSNDVKYDEVLMNIPSSNGKINYKVTYKRGSWNCTCKGFGFRRKCKHIEIAKELINDR